ncbi:MAG: two-component sensor histidine kinase [Gammaproteobacteria bacterium]|nr:MAG: two-component sensor histidine kinase [Gammaproteobacteria bacterium]
MIFRTLYSRLALTLFILLCLVGLILVQLIGQSSLQYQQEVAQKLNSTLAEHIVAEQELIKDQMVNYAVSDSLFHDLMIINPSIELYLLDKQGVVMGYNAPEGKVKRDRVSLQPLQQFFSDDVIYPLKGDDPRNESSQKVFSAAKITNKDGLQGYLYIVLGSEQYDDVVQMLGRSYIFDSSLWVLMVALVAALLSGLIIFGLQTRRLRLLGNVMRDYAGKSKDGSSSIRFPASGKSKDEVDALGSQFNVMAEKINQQIHELQRTDGMRREMVANISHDLRTPLTTMRGYLETLLLKDESLSPDDQRKYIETALSHSKHLGKLVEQLFELARLDSCESVVYSEPFSMGELVQDVTQSYMLRAQQKSVQLRANLKPDVPLIYGDIAMMQRVLENLIENGLRHTPDGGRISISVDVDSGNVIVRVADTGCGIPAEDVSRIFERFYQQDVNRTGNKNSGLGLAIVKRILELHGSAIKVRSKINQGTTFSFQLTTKPSF